MKQEPFIQKILGGKDGVDLKLLRNASMAIVVLGVISPQKLIGWACENGGVAFLCCQKVILKVRH